MPQTDLQKRKAYARKYYEKNRDKFLAYAYVYHRKDIRNYLLKSAKRRSKLYGLAFNLTVDDIVIPEFCPVFGIKLEIGIGKRSPNSPSIDRINNSKGYTKDNIAIISWKANEMKRDMSLAQAEALVNYMKNAIRTRS